MKCRATSFLALSSMVEMRETVRSNSELHGVIGGGRAGNCFVPYLKSSRRGFVLSADGGVSVEEIGSGCGETSAMSAATIPFRIENQDDLESPRSLR